MLGGGHNQKRTMWLYIIVLSLIVFIFWLFVFSRQLKIITRETNEDKAVGLGEILSDFSASVKYGSEALSDYWSKLSEKSLFSSSSSTSTLEIDQSEQIYIDKLKEILENSTTTLNLNNQ